MRRLSRPAAADHQPAGAGDRTSNLPELVARLSADEPIDMRSRSRLIGRLAGLLAGRARAAGAAAVTSGRWLSDVVMEVAPHVPVRDLATLRAHHDGLTGDALAAALVTAASRTTAAIGAAGGAVAAVEFTAPPALLTAPVLLAAETLAVVAVEMKLVAELHEVYGQGAHGGPAERGTAYMMAWVRRRGVHVGERMGIVLGGAARRELRRRLLRKTGRGLTTFAPFLAGAVAGAQLNRLETRRLAESIIDDLRSAYGPG